MQSQAPGPSDLCLQHSLGVSRRELPCAAALLESVPWRSWSQGRINSGSTCSFDKLRPLKALNILLTSKWFDGVPAPCSRCWGSSFLPVTGSWQLQRLQHLQRTFPSASLIVAEIIMVCWTSLGLALRASQSGAALESRRPVACCIQVRVRLFKHLHVMSKIPGTRMLLSSDQKQAPTIAYFFYTLSCTSIFLLVAQLNTRFLAFWLQRESRGLMVFPRPEFCR